MGKLLLAAATLAFAACQPMYGAPAPRLKNPVPNHPVGGGEPPPAAIVYVEECEFHTTALSGKPKRDIQKSQDYVVKADTNMAGADKAKQGKDKGDMLIDSIQEYGTALQKDPYNAEATLKLARAYDVVRRKGCALALLDRLQKLSNNPLFEKAATTQIDDVENNRAWFGGYRKDALKAVGRP